MRRPRLVVPLTSRRTRSKERFWQLSNRGGAALRGAVSGVLRAVITGFLDHLT
ncbi:hypothetical protein [Streptomyces sp. NPDC048643]|uniref:hypothetical protein n=1 Tax=Streptomyces sp. NPDC048643 TaxID=3155637 RepID=UPI00342D898B